MYIWRLRPQKEKHPHPPKTNTNRRFVLDFLAFYLSICLTISLLRLTWLPNYLPNYLTISTLYETSAQTYLPIGLTIGMHVCTHVRMYVCTHARASERARWLPIEMQIEISTDWHSHWLTYVQTENNICRKKMNAKTKIVLVYMKSIASACFTAS